MAIRTTSVGRVFVARWGKVVVPQDLADMIAGLSSATQRAAGPHVLVIVLDGEMPPPPAELRSHGIRTLRQAIELTVAVEIVAAGQGLLGTLQRSAARSAITLSSALRGRVHVQSSLEHALEHASTHVQLDVESAHRLLTAEGLAP